MSSFHTFELLLRYQSRGSLCYKHKNLIEANTLALQQFKKKKSSSGFSYSRNAVPGSFKVKQNLQGEENQATRFKLQL